jgi:DNA (cytosine-5)-methyltransferase 1
VEIDTDAAETFISSLVRDGMDPVKAGSIVITDDITKKETKEKLYKVCPKADVIIGGPPCQSFSLIGPRSGDIEKKKRFANDHRDNLFKDYIEIVNYYKPKVFVFENVKGISSKRNDDNFRYADLIVESFEKIGYRLDLENQQKKYMLLNAAEYGVPQFRERFFIIGNNIGYENPVPKKTHCMADQAGMIGLKPCVNVRAAIGDLPFIMPKITLTKYNNSYSFNEGKWMKYIMAENEKRNNGEDPMKYHWGDFDRHYSNCSAAEKQFLDFVKPRHRDALLTGHIARSHQMSDIILFEGIPEGCSSANLIDSKDPKLIKLAGLIKYKMDSFRDKYKKMAWDRPSLTVFAHLQKDGNRFIHPDSRQARTITVREAARLQSFPDDYEFKARGNKRFKHIGNAVPPILAMAIARSIYDTLTSHH